MVDLRSPGAEHSRWQDAVHLMTAVAVLFILLWRLAWYQPGPIWDPSVLHLVCLRSSRDLTLGATAVVIDPALVS